MRTHTIETLASSLAQPLNSAIQKSDGARFSLMLSLLHEGRYAESLPTENISAIEIAATHHQTLAPAFHLNLSLNQALQQNSHDDFKLLNSLYYERVQNLYAAPDVKPLPINNSTVNNENNNPETLMHEIAQSRQQALLLSA